SLLEEVQSFNCRYVTVTGGEPLAQPDCTGLLNDLCDLGFQVSLETAGALDVSQVDKRVSIVMDLKTPGSGEVTRNLYSNLDRLSHKDQVKMVICDRIDYEWARFKLAEYDIGGRAGEVLLSPAWGQMDPAELAGWILGDKLSVRLQLQLHKQLWGDKPGV
ncbi:MAG: 7-carboxy-7-deazaguanine synthase QueE, partial [Gammaproteobacteria bacterium]|nr:7-carboxy-7-deazaguanine synthase QueE [Gammaproteobacteria bacterium]